MRVPHKFSMPRVWSTFVCAMEELRALMLLGCQHAAALHHALPQLLHQLLRRLWLVQGLNLMDTGRRGGRRDGIARQHRVWVSAVVGGRLNCATMIEFLVVGNIAASLLQPNGVATSVGTLGGKA